MSCCVQTQPSTSTHCSQSRNTHAAGVSCEQPATVITVCSSRDRPHSVLALHTVSTGIHRPPTQSLHHWHTYSVDTHIHKHSVDRHAAPQAQSRLGSRYCFHGRDGVAIALPWLPSLSSQILFVACHKAAPLILARWLLEQWQIKEFGKGAVVSHSE